MIARRLRAIWERWRRPHICSSCGHLPPSLRADYHAGVLYRDAMGYEVTSPGAVLGAPLADSIPLHRGPLSAVVASPRRL